MYFYPFVVNYLLIINYFIMRKIKAQRFWAFFSLNYTLVVKISLR